MKKIISILICITMFFSMCSLSGYAFEVEDEFNISDYSWDDIMTMSNSDFRQLLADFERVYDPFDTYETDPIMAMHNDSDNSNTIQPRWTSGNAEHTETGSHELITARACGVLLNDKGFWGANENGSIIIALTLSLASILPDTDASLGINQLFAGHFYNPLTGKNWLGSTTNTAKTNTKDNYDAACTEYNINGLSDDFIISVGKMLHYVQDVCEPHHAANITGLQNHSNHSLFEALVHNNINTYIDSLTTLSNSTYNNGSSLTVEDLVDEAAILAYVDSVYVRDESHLNEWENVGYRSTRNAVTYSAVILYKLSLQVNISLI